MAQTYVIWNFVFLVCMSAMALVAYNFLPFSIDEAVIVLLPPILAAMMAGLRYGDLVGSTPKASYVLRLGIAFELCNMVFRLIYMFLLSVMLAAIGRENAFSIFWSILKDAFAEISNVTASFAVILSFSTYLAIIVAVFLFGAWRAVKQV